VRREGGGENKKKTRASPKSRLSRTQGKEKYKPDVNMKRGGKKKTKIGNVLLSRHMGKTKGRSNRKITPKVAGFNKNKVSERTTGAEEERETQNGS